MRDFENCVALEEYYGQWLVYDWVPRYANLRRFRSKAEAEAYIAEYAKAKADTSSSDIPTTDSQTTS